MKFLFIFDTIMCFMILAFLVTFAIALVVEIKKRKKFINMVNDEIDSIDLNNFNDKGDMKDND